jgi:cytochrome c oxidase subunit 4
VSDQETLLQHELGDEDLQDPFEAGTAAHDHPAAKEYIRIGLILGVLTALEVATYYVDMDHAILIPTLLGLAVVKFVMVVMWFMHLRFDNRLYARFFVMGLALASTLYLIVLLIFNVFSN